MCFLAEILYKQSIILLSETLLLDPPSPRSNFSPAGGGGDSSGVEGGVRWSCLAVD
jgi:hypothetical protein